MQFKSVLLQSLSCFILLVDSWEARAGRGLRGHLVTPLLFTCSGPKDKNGPICKNVLCFLHSREATESIYGELISIYGPLFYFWELWNGLQIFFLLHHPHKCGNSWDPLGCIVGETEVQRCHVSCPWFPQLVFPR